MFHESFPKTSPHPEVARISSAEAEAFDRLKPKFEELRINMDEFEGVYKKEEIEHDKDSVRRKKERIEQAHTEPTKRAQILEALLAEQIELSDWLGPDAMTIIPTEYDDLFHGVDMTAEFQRDDSLQHLAMGVDVTTSPASIEKKLSIIREHLMDGTLTEMKYFTSERLPDFHGRMANIPSIVIGADARTIHELAELWLAIDQSKNPEPGTDAVTLEELREKAREAQQKLARHRVQVLILKQIQAQLEKFATFAQRHTREDKRDELVAKLKSLGELIEGILSEKKVSRTQEELNEMDDVYQSLRKTLDTLFT